MCLKEGQRPKCWLRACQNKGFSNRHGRLGCSPTLPCIWSVLEAQSIPRNSISGGGGDARQLCGRSTWGWGYRMVRGKGHGLLSTGWVNFSHHSVIDTRVLVKKHFIQVTGIFSCGIELCWGFCFSISLAIQDRLGSSGHYRDIRYHAQPL